MRQLFLLVNEIYSHTLPVVVILEIRKYNAIDDKEEKVVHISSDKGF